MQGHVGRPVTSFHINKNLILFHALLQNVCSIPMMALDAAEWQFTIHQLVDEKSALFQLDKTE